MAGTSKISGEGIVDMTVGDQCQGPESTVGNNVREQKGQWETTLGNRKDKQY